LGKKNGTRMARIGRIFADLIRKYLPDPRYPRVISMRLSGYEANPNCQPRK
jgi:hypothetical protein